MRRCLNVRGSCYQVCTKASHCTTKLGYNVYIGGYKQFADEYWLVANIQIVSSRLQISRSPICISSYEIDRECVQVVTRQVANIGRGHICTRWLYAQQFQVQACRGYLQAVTK